MRVLTVRQPYAWAIIHGGKKVENRSRNIAGDYRGPVAIHAAVAINFEALTTPMIVGAVAFKRLSVGPGHPSTFKESPEGAILGVVDLVDVHKPDCTGCSPWAFDDHHHFELANPLPFTAPIPAKGRLGLWRPDTELAAQIETALAGEAR